MKLRSLGLALGAVFFFLGYLTPSMAITINYIGNDYTAFDPNPPLPDLGTSLTGSVTFDFLSTPADGTYLTNGSPCQVIGSCVEGHIVGVSLHSGLYDASANATGFVTITGGNISAWHLSTDATCGIFCDVVLHTGNF